MPRCGPWCSRRWRAAILAILRVKHPAARLRVWTFVLCAGAAPAARRRLLPDHPGASAAVRLDAGVHCRRTCGSRRAFSIQSAETAAPRFLPMPLVLLVVYVLGVAGLAVRAGRGWLAALRLEWNCGAIADRDALERLADTLRISDSDRRRAPARIGWHRRAGDDVRLAAGGGVACRLARVAGRDARRRSRSRAVARRCAAIR